MGGTAEIARIARAAQTLIEEVRENASVAIAVETRIVDIEYDDVEEFERDISESELGSINRITVDVTDGGDEGCQIKVVIGEPAPVLHLYVRGRERTFVEGASTQMHEVIRREGRYPRYQPETIGRAVAVVVALVLMVASTLILYRVYGTEDWLATVLLLFLPAIGIVLPVAYLVGDSVNRRFPHLELVSPGERTTFEVVRTWFRRGALALTGLVGAAVVTNAVDKLF